MLLVAILISSALTTGGIPAGAEQLPFESLGRALLDEAHERTPEGEAHTTPRYEELLVRLEPLHERLRLGAFELWVPRRVLQADGKLKDGPGVRSVEASAERLLDLQHEWLVHLDLGRQDVAPCEEAFETLRRWLGSLRSGPLPSIEPEIAAAREVVERRFSARVLHESDSFAPPPFELVMILAPTRAHYVGLIGAAGIVWPERKTALWVDSAKRSTAAGLAPELMCVALSEGPDEEGVPPLQNYSMEQGLATQTIVHMASHLFSNRLLPMAPAWFVEGLAIVDTIGLLRRDDTTCSGQRARAEVLALDPAGMLNFVSVDLSPYRGDEAERWFTRKLKPEPTGARFEIIDLDTGSPGTTADAPFLAPASKVGPNVTTGTKGVQKGFAEFFRAYCATFVRYLDRLEFDDRPMLTKLIVMLRERTNVAHLRFEEQFLAALELLTHKSLGLSDKPEDDIEAAYVAWLRKGKRTN